eukprot:353554-Chlamydomonas_euryale.AAC.1
MPSAPPPPSPPPSSSSESCSSMVRPPEYFDTRADCCALFARAAALARSAATMSFTTPRISASSALLSTWPGPTRSIAICRAASAEKQAARLRGGR